MAQPDSSAPAVSSLSTNAGNGSASAQGSVVSGATGYRMWRRGLYSPWELLPALSAPRWVQPVINGVEWRFAIQAVSAGGTAGAWTLGSAVSGSNDRVRALTGVAVAPGNGSLLVSWDPLPGAGFYNVYTSSVPGGPLTGVGSTSDPYDTRAVINQTNGMPISALVYAVSEQNVYGDHSGEATGTPLASLPATPSVTLTAGNEAMGLDWPNVSGATSYRVYRRTSSTDWALQTTLTNSVFTDYDVQNGENVRYAVQAVNANGPGAWGFTSMSLVNPALGRAPEDVRLQPGNGTLQVEWTPVPTATSYYVYTGTSALGPWSLVTAPAGMFESRSRVGATNGTPTFVRVVTLTAAGAGVASEPVSAAAAAALPITTYGSATAGGMPGRVTVTWSAVSGATAYHVWRRPSNGAPAEVTMTTLTSFADMGLISGSGYVYYVEAENGAGRGAWSDPMPATAP
jgi:hypothetical protein